MKNRRFYSELIIILVLSSCFMIITCTTKATAQVRNKYLECGDNYLKKMDSEWDTARRQSFAIAALASYVAAQIEE